MDINSNNRDRFNELLFENRNKNYGAYVIRKTYDRRLVLSSLISLSLIVFAMFAPKFFSGMKQIIPIAIKEDPTHILKIVEVTVPPKVVPPTTTSVHPPTKGNSFLPLIPVDSNEVLPPDTTTHTITGIQGDPHGIDSTNIDPNKITGNGGNTIVVAKPKDPTSFPDVYPEFPGGMDGLSKFLKDHIKYPREAIEDDIKGTIYLSFTVDENGKVIDIKNMNSVGGGLDKEAIRVASLMPNWKPGTLGGEKVSVKYNLPVRFALK